MLALSEVFNKDLPFAVKPGIAVWRLIPTFKMAELSEVSYEAA